MEVKKGYKEKNEKTEEGQEIKGKDRKEDQKRTTREKKDG